MHLSYPFPAAGIRFKSPGRLHFPAARSRQGGTAQLSLMCISGISSIPILHQLLRYPGFPTPASRFHFHLHRFSTIPAPCSSYSFFEIHI
jgi:hypothetical protein